MFFGATPFAEAPFSSEGSINRNVILTGVQAYTVVSSVSIQAGGNIYIVAGTEAELQSTVNTVSITANADVTLNTNSLTIFLGNADVLPNTIVNLTSNLITTYLGSVEADANTIVNLTSNLITTYLGNNSITGDANVTLSTNLLTVSLGTVDAIPNTLVNVTGLSLNTTTGTVSLITDANVAVVGVSMIARTKGPYIVCWNVVNINVNNSWSVVDIAA